MSRHGPARVAYRDCMADQDLLAALLTLERKGWDSLCDGTGDAFYGEMMTEDAVMVLANGEVMDRDTVVAALGKAPSWLSYDISEPQLIHTGPESAALVYRGIAYREADGPAFVGLMSSVYLSREGKWRLALYQQTAIPADNA